MQYSTPTYQRAERALRCTPFQFPLFAAMRVGGVPLLEIAGREGVQRGYTQQPLLELVAESHLLWLIQVGLLRREVDGQGITDSFRLTPLGRQVLERWQQESASRSPASPRDRLGNFLHRWLRLPV